MRWISCDCAPNTVNFIEQRWQLGPWNKQTNSNHQTKLFSSVQFKSNGNSFFSFFQFNERDTFLKCKDLQIIFCFDIQFDSTWNLIHSKLNDSIAFFFFHSEWCHNLFDLNQNECIRKNRKILWHRKIKFYQINGNFEILKLPREKKPLQDLSFIKFSLSSLPIILWRNIWIEWRPILVHKNYLLIDRLNKCV